MRLAKKLGGGLAVAALLLVSQPGHAGPVDAKPNGGITTLYVLDPLACSVSLADGEYGHVIQDHMVRNRNSDIDFGSYAAGQFAVGIEGGRMGAIVDLGTSRELQRRYEYSDTVGFPQGFASLQLKDGRLVILKDRDAHQPVKEAELLMAVKSGALAPVSSGHVYLVRIVDRHDASFERIAKLVVLETRPEESVTFRWERLK
jgi:hypothetical protein